MNEHFHWASSKQTCEFYGVTPNTVRRWASTNKIKFKRKPSNQRVYYIPKSYLIPNQTQLQKQPKRQLRQKQPLSQQPKQKTIHGKKSDEWDYVKIISMD